MASSTQYHILPEEAGRPSTDTLTDESRGLLQTETLFEPPKKSEISFTDLHITLYLRIGAFVFFLTATIVLGVCGEDVRWGHHKYNNSHVIPSIVFLTFALARNAYAIFSHLISSFVKVSISLEVSGKGKSRFKLPAWLKKKLIGILIDAIIIVALFIVLPIGIVQNQEWVFPGVNAGFAVAFTGM